MRGGGIEMMPATSGVMSVLLLLLLAPVLAIVAGLLIFFLGRRYVRKKYGKK